MVEQNNPHRADSPLTDGNRNGTSGMWIRVRERCRGGSYGLSTVTNRAAFPAVNRYG